MSKFIKYLRNQGADRKLGEREPALECFERDVRLSPDLAVAYSNLGLIYTEPGRKREALAA